MVHPLRFGVPTRVLSKRVPIDHYDEVEKHIDAILTAYENRIPITLPTDVYKIYRTNPLTESQSCQPPT